MNYYFHACFFIFFNLTNTTFGQEDDFFSSNKEKDTANMSIKGIAEVGVGIPVSSWGSNVNSNTSIIAPLEGSEGMGFKPNIFVKAGIEYKFNPNSKPESKINLVFQALGQANLFNRIDWEDEYLEDIKFREEVWDAGLSIGLGIDFSYEKFSYSLVPSVYIPAYMVLPNYVVNDNFNKEMYTEQWLNEGEKFSVYSDEHLPYSNSEYTLGFGIELRAMFKDSYFVKFEYTHMNINRTYVYKTESYDFENDNIIQKSNAQRFNSNYNITNFRIGLGVKF